MKFFLDTAEVDEIAALAGTGLVDGVTTNPSLVAKSGRDFKAAIAEICRIVPGPVSAEVVADRLDGMLAEGRTLAAIAPNVVVKLPLTLDGLAAARAFAQEGIRTNVTLCFATGQALLAAKAGATYVSPFVGRLDDVQTDGMQLIRDIRSVFDRYGYQTLVLAASIRTPLHVVEAARAGADVATMPAAVVRGLAEHPLTAQGLARFADDWARTGQSIVASS
jgi:transaldolase